MCIRDRFLPAQVGVRCIVGELKREQAKREFVEPARARVVVAAPNEGADGVAGFVQ